MDNAFAEKNDADNATKFAIFIMNLSFNFFVAASYEFDD